MSVNGVLIILVFVASASASALPKVKKFEINDHLRAVIPPERIQSIESQFQKVSFSSGDSDDLDCVQGHLDNITRINVINSQEIYACSNDYASKVVVLDRRAKIDKEDTDDEFDLISRSLRICEKVADTEKGLQCQADLKTKANVIISSSNKSKKTLEELHNDKDRIKIEKSWRINDSVTRANNQIEEEHTKIMEC